MVKLLGLVGRARPDEQREQMHVGHLNHLTERYLFGRGPRSAQSLIQYFRGAARREVELELLTHPQEELIAGDGRNDTGRSTAAPRRARFRHSATRARQSKETVRVRAMRRSGCCSRSSLTKGG